MSSLITNEVKPAGDKIFVHLPHFLQEKIGNVFIPSHLDYEKYAQVKGTIRGIGPRCPHPQLRLGDIVALHYLVTSSYEYDEHDNPVFDLCYRIGEEMVWQVDPSQILGLWRDDAWHAVGDWVLMEEVLFDIPESIGSIAMPTELLEGTKRPGLGRFISGDIAAPIGSHLCFQEKFRSTYSFPWPDGTVKTYIVLNKDFIHAYVQAN